MSSKPAGAGAASRLNAGVAVFATALSLAFSPRALSQVGGESDPLARHVADAGAPESIRTVFTYSLATAGTAGGIEFSEDCSERSIRLQPNSGGTVGDVLDMIEAARPDLQHSLSPAGAPYVRPRPASSPRPGLLDVRLSQFAVPDRSNLVGALDRILHAREVRARIAELGLSIEPIEAGFQSLPAEGAPAPEPKPLSMTAPTVREVLSALAESSGTPVWVYRENTCVSPVSIALTFDAR